MITYTRPLRRAPPGGQGYGGEIMPATDSKERILKAALAVVSNNSISGTRMHLIAREAGMSSANLHYHFETKDELLTALIQDVQQHFQSLRNGALTDCGGTLEESLRAFFWNKRDQILQGPDYDKVEFDYWVTAQSDDKIRRLLQENFGAWHAHIVSVILSFRPALPRERAELIAHSMVSMMKGGTMQYLLDPNFDLDTYFELCLAQTLYGIDAPPPAQG